MKIGDLVIVKGLSGSKVHVGTVLGWDYPMYPRLVTLMINGEKRVFDERELDVL
tara:strand:- start:3811 stop:3972 length:162 start_codon:yes stop_codon:yes gene_type:complete